MPSPRERQTDDRERRKTACERRGHPAFGDGLRRSASKITASSHAIAIASACAADETTAAAIAGRLPQRILRLRVTRAPRRGA
jgi:hypothetical protein